jgi:transposase
LDPSIRGERIRPMPRPRKYPDGLRERAVRVVIESKRPVAQVARELGINPESLRNWVRQAEADAGLRADRLTSEERERLKALERENRDLRRGGGVMWAHDVTAHG